MHGSLVGILRRRKRKIFDALSCTEEGTGRLASCGVSEEDLLCVVFPAIIC